MKKSEAIYYSVFIILIITGWFVSGYGGGIITGVGISMLLAALIGKAVFKKTVTRIDKQVKDIITNQQ